ncbi:phosphoinositide 5-phosphatase [Malassezia yamatoensis]|uniref:phosphoinositide 5-phosphatase n=1 Tax=Malassezia yamatoensis TaxID=253288 RepID=A0AAJ5YYB3_9BASI|nr:phosphoinositide 5-phosphatase [Malassezia yamatoensis]
MHVWLAEATAEQRTLLVSRYDPYDSHSGSEMVLSFSVCEGQCSLSLLNASELDWKPMQRLTMPSLPLVGLLGILKIDTDVFLACVTHASRVGSWQAGKFVDCVRSVTFFCVNRSLSEDDLSRQNEAGVPTTSESPYASIRKYLQSGSFFFAEHNALDLTRRVAQTSAFVDLDQGFASPYAWNAYMMEPILHYRARITPSCRADLDQAAFFLLLIQGFVGIASIPLGPARNSTASLAVVSRLSAQRAGTRFNARGIDDQGNAANFVETETILAFGEKLFSFVQLRGSVPIYWEQQGMQALTPKIQITRTGLASEFATQQHMQRLLDDYGRVFVLDLLGTRDAETLLSHAYVGQIDRLLTHLSSSDSPGHLRYYNFDFHTITKATGGLDGTRAELDRLHNVQTQRQQFGYTLVHLNASHQDFVMMQTGVFRVNCFDCLDRTNVVQGCLSHSTLRDFFITIRREKYQDPSLALLQQATNLPESLWPIHGQLWAQNGDILSQINTGTGSLNSDYTRTGVKKSFTGMLSDAAKSASRMYMNNFQDASKQQAIDTLLGTRSGQEQVILFDPVYRAVHDQLETRRMEYTHTENWRMFLGTYNVCAQAAQRLDPWLQHAKGADIIAIGLQEIVPLTAQQMLTSSAAEPMQHWERMILHALRNEDDSYVVLRCELLFATSLIVLVKDSMLKHVHNVEATTKKTGFRGMSGNKGGVAIRMDVHDTGVCFVGSHLAAGNTNVDERNNDFGSIARGMQFPRGRTISSHPHVFWLGDLNYRLDSLSSAEVRGLCAEISANPDADAARGVLAKLHQHDQLKSAQASHAAFDEYSEGPLLFKPTYKYDLHSDTYDSSEKARTPAWTDRILYRTNMKRAKAIQLDSYGCIDLRISDHRPVYATIRADIDVVDTQKRTALQDQLLGTLNDQQSTLLPSPSDTQQQWWKLGSPLAPIADDTPGNPFLSTHTLPATHRTKPPPMPPRPHTQRTSQAGPGNVSQISSADVPPIPQRPDLG